jgi:hypothetical protein
MRNGLFIEGFYESKNLSKDRVRASLPVDKAPDKLKALVWWTISVKQARQDQGL